MHPADIKAALEKAGSSQSAIARSLRTKAGGSITPGAVHLVVLGASKSQRVAMRISEVTGLPVSLLWPGKYPALEKLEALVRSQAKKAATAKAAKARKPAEAPIAAPAAQGELEITYPKKPGRLGRKREGPSAARDARSNHREHR